MIKHNDEYIVVATRYDSPVLSIKEPYFEEITVSDDPSLVPHLYFKDYRLSSEEKGLEGVKFLHFEEGSNGY